jgi:hypothetical protein
MFIKRCKYLILPLFICDGTAFVSKTIFSFHHNVFCGITMLSDRSRKGRHENKGTFRSWFETEDDYNSDRFRVNSCWPSRAKSFLVPGSAGPRTIFSASRIWLSRETAKAVGVRVSNASAITRMVSLLEDCGTMMDCLPTSFYLYDFYVND